MIKNAKPLLSLPKEGFGMFQIKFASVKEPSCPGMSAICVILMDA